MPSKLRLRVVGASYFGNGCRSRSFTLRLLRAYGHIDPWFRPERALFNRSVANSHGLWFSVSLVRLTVILSSCKSRR